MKNYYEYDELRIYRGSDIYITDKIVITQPTVGQIEEFGERRYFNGICTLTSVGVDLIWQLHKNGIDFTTISDYDLFRKYICQAVSSKKHILRFLENNYYADENYAKMYDELSDDDKEEMLINPLQLILKDIDFADFIECNDPKINEPILYNQDKDITIDRTVYMRLVDVIRKMHGFKRNNRMPANETAKQDFIEDARDEYIASKHESFKSVLLPYVSSLINHPSCSYKHNDIWDLGVYAFFDSVKRIDKIQDATLLLQGAYSGFASLKGVDKERLNWCGDLNKKN